VIDFWTAVAAEARDLAPLEVVAVAAAIAYLVLAIRQSIWCWLGAGISTEALHGIGAEPFLFRNGHLRLVRMVFRAVR
jgi:hypothetical protein